MYSMYCIIIISHLFQTYTFVGSASILMYMTSIPNLHICDQYVYMSLASVSLI